MDPNRPILSPDKIYTVMCEGAMWSWTFYLVITRGHAFPNYTILQPPRSGPPPDPLGPCAQGQYMGSNFTIKRLFFTFRGGSFFLYIYNASASKRIIANELGCNVC